MPSKVYFFIGLCILAQVILVPSPSRGLNRSLFNTLDWQTTKSARAGNDDEPEIRSETFDYSLVLKDLKGNKVMMDQFKGKVIFLNEWATWCGPCRAEMPSIQKLYDAVNKDIVFVMLSRDQPDDTPKIIKYISAIAFTFPVFQPAGDLPKQLDSPSIPASWIISKDGKIVKKEIGIINPSEFKSLLDVEAKK
jgi:thiol-disulfide isomerase/thioredoxin